jgi:hypothetical protein
MSVDDSSLEAREAVHVKSEKKRKNGPQKDPDKSANKKSRSENTVLEEDQYDVSTNHFALFHPF